MKIEYDETRVGRLQMLLNSCYREIAKLKETRHDCAKGIGTVQKELAAIQFATDMGKERASVKKYR